MNFEQLNLVKPLLEGVAECGYDEPTPIQRETIPAVLDGRDVLGCAQTGTGKTAAFALPMLQRLSLEMKQHTGKRTIRALILTPTRELALQIYENFEAYGKKLPLRSCVIFGGVNQQPQVQKLKAGVDILVATPGRLGDLINQGFIALDHIEIFVLDEADRMLDMGFIHDVRKIIALLPQKRQTLFFSATMPPEVEKLAMGILTTPVNVKVDPVTSTVDAIDQCVYLVDKVNKKLLLADMLKKPEVESALVFSRTKHGADKIVRELARMGVKSLAIHGDKSQAARQEALAQFKNGKSHVLIATDIAARGIDIAGLSHVFNYDLPNEPEAYIHRIGRTGRAGLDGTAISFCCIDEMKDLYAIEKLIGKHLPRKESAWPMAVFEETVKVPRPPRPGRGLPVVQLKADGRGRGARGAQGERDARGGSAMNATARRSAGSAQGEQTNTQGKRRSAGASSLADAAATATGGGAQGVRQSATKGSGARRGMSGSGAATDASNGTSFGASSARGGAGRGAARSARQPSGENSPVRKALEREAAAKSGASAPAKPAMRATPLERSTQAAPARRTTESDWHGERHDTPAPETNYVKVKKTRRPLSTGEDRW